MLTRVLALAALAAGAREPPALDFALSPVGRVFASTDPDASADMFTAVVRGASRVDQNLSRDDACARVVAVRAPLGHNATAGDAGQLLYFVRAERGPLNASASLAPYAAHAARAFAAQNARAIVYDAWSDNHDGYYRTDAFDVDATVSRAPYFSYEIEEHPELNYTSWPYAALNAYVPNTTFNFQLWGDMSGAPGDALAPFVLPEWERCRNESAAAKPSGGLDSLWWWKATGATDDVAAAAAFVEAALGSVHVPGPFPEANPPPPNCTTARWVLLQPGSSFMLHFVWSGEFAAPPDGGLDPALALPAWSASVRAARASLAAAAGPEGVAADGYELDGWMDNRVVFWADAIGRVAARLDALGVPYSRRAFGAPSTVVALLVADNATALAFEIRGDDAELAAAAPLYECLR